MCGIVCESTRMSETARRSTLYTPWISSWVIWLEIAEHARVASQRLCISKLHVGPAKRGLDEVWVLRKWSPCQGIQRPADQSCVDSKRSVNCEDQTSASLDSDDLPSIQK